MFFTNIFNFKKKCTHDKITPNIETAYCPDCGKLIKNEWYITRCACCGVKIKAAIRGDEIVTQNHYCSNCGSQEYFVEKLDKINFIDINFAVLKKTEVNNSQENFVTQCWQEKTSLQPKLLAQYL